MKKIGNFPDRIAHATDQELYADYHQIVDQIRAFVQATDQTRTPVLDELRRCMPRHVRR